MSGEIGVDRWWWGDSGQEAGGALQLVADTRYTHTEEHVLKEALGVVEMTQESAE